ncbi:hypothetical protein KJ966_11770 [bacterium]|nr:hypothetical protein [bacterium]
MKENYNIIVADRDRRVREFLNREMKLAGYRVWLAKNGFELINQLSGIEPMDLLILDPDFPDAEEDLLIREVTEKFPLLPIIVHTYSFDKQRIPASCNTIVFVEKRGSSIDLLIKNVTNILRTNRVEETISSG